MTNLLSSSANGTDHNNNGTLPQDVTATYEPSVVPLPGSTTRSCAPEVAIDAGTARRILSEVFKVEHGLLVFMTPDEVNTFINSVEDLPTRLALRRCWAVVSAEGPVRGLDKKLSSKVPPAVAGPTYHAELPVGSRRRPASTVSFDHLYADSQGQHSDIKTMTAIEDQPFQGPWTKEEMINEVLLTSVE
ncbi:hypothetical protein FOL47_002203, partial [Perkinsus chesapeaki]